MSIEHTLCSLTIHHVQRKRRLRKSGSNSTFSTLRKELREGNVQALLGGSQFLISSNTEPDPLLSSFIYNPSLGDQPGSVQSHSSVEACLVKEVSKEESLKRYENFVVLIIIIFLVIFVFCEQE